ncbi:hypothetical protein ACFQ48_14050 [Hymenobacter caeli]|uniref:STAS/SEC14 domain-containing protein n=1 Tax=Hymenobacter caeli TaxID=2735894 RepID=A0ABX2FTH2_9BACT|nr:hypothetical protein [Hymenobacter caeli]NRT20490.1 hypothetical protein [Hymenobacter caeli]
MNPNPAARPQPAADDFLHLAYRPDLHLLVGRWRRPVSGAELRRGYRALLAAAEAAACPRWLVDVRGRGPLDADAARWLLGEFLPRLPACLPGPVCLGYLVSPRQRAPAGPVGPAPAGTQVEFFEDEGALNHWLAPRRAAPGGAA